MIGPTNGRAQIFSSGIEGGEFTVGKKTSVDNERVKSADAEKARQPRTAVTLAARPRRRLKIISSVIGRSVPGEGIVFWDVHKAVPPLQKEQ